MGVSTPRKRDSLGALLAIGAAVAAVVGIVWLPFALGPAAVIAVLIGALMSQRHTMLIRTATFIVGIAFLLGAAIAVAGSHPLY